jgi:hypothetical protein
MIDAIAFNAGGGGTGLSAGQTVSISAQFIGGTASLSGTPCFSQVTCSGANVGVTYNGLVYQTMNYVFPQSSTMVSVNLGMIGSMIFPADLSPSIQLMIPISVIGTLRFSENGVTTNVVTLMGTGTASVTAIYQFTLEGRGAIYDIGIRATMSFTGIATDPLAVPEPSMWLLMGTGLAWIAIWKRRRSHMRFAVMVTTIVLMLSTFSFASTVTLIDFPNANETIAQDINNNGVIVGGYVMEGSGYQVFIRDADENYIAIGLPVGATSALANGINDIGMIAGQLWDSGGTQHGFVLDSLGNYTVFDAPGSTFTRAFGINNYGVTVGDSSNGSFLRDASGNFTYLNSPAPGISVQAFGINDDGAVVGLVQVFNGGGFLRDPSGNYTLLDLPPHAYALDINNAGDIIGNNGNLGFIRYSDGTYGQAYVPGSVTTQVIGMNDVGFLVGYYGPAPERQAFLMSDYYALPSSVEYAPAPEPSTILLMVSGLGAMGLWQWRRKVFSSPHKTF